jgi:hypothetical protein
MIQSEHSEALAISSRIVADLLKFNISASGDDGANLRSMAGKLISDFNILLATKTVGASLYACFEQARLAGATLIVMNDIRTAMFAEVPTFLLGTSIVNAAVIFSFVEQSQIISRMEFGSRVEVETLMDQMLEIIEDIKLNKADSFSSSDYQNFVNLSASLVNHLSSTERQLPRIVHYTMSVNYPALTLSNLIYRDGSRSEELIAENQTVHPAFMQRNVVALSE